MSMSERIQEKLQQLAPVHVELTNESHMHNVPANSETHFNLVLVASAFEGKRQVQRHQVVYRALSDELRSGLHALTMKTLTPTEWQAQGSAPNVSPLCLGGSKHG